jgi:hypothetical protein
MVAQPINAEVKWMREALGAVAVGAPAAFRLRRSGGGWAVQREGDGGETQYPSRAAAMTAIHLAVVRCASYAVTLQDGDGWHVIESWAA